MSSYDALALIGLSLSKAMMLTHAAGEWAVMGEGIAEKKGSRAGRLSLRSLYMAG